MTPNPDCRLPRPIFWKKFGRLRPGRKTGLSAELLGRGHTRWEQVRERLEIGRIGAERAHGVPLDLGDDGFVERCWYSQSSTLGDHESIQLFDLCAPAAHHVL
jgi:hypothetical protein